MPLYLLPGVKLPIRLTKARPSFCLMIKSVDSKNVFKFLDAQLLVRRVRTNTAGSHCDAEKEGESRAI